MKYIIPLIIICISFNSCGFDLEMPGYRFSNFENTPVWSLAKAIEDNDAEKVREILSSKKVNVDFKESKFSMKLYCR